MNGTVDFGLWFDHVLEWWKYRDAENILILKYEDMKKDHRGVVKKIAKFMGYDLKEEVIDMIVEKSTFQSMKENPATHDFYNKFRKPDADFFQKGVVGDWRSHFTPQQNVEFDTVYAGKMKGSGLDFDLICKIIVSQNVILASNTCLTHEIKFVTTLKNGAKLINDHNKI